MDLIDKHLKIPFYNLRIGSGAGNKVKMMKEEVIPEGVLRGGLGRYCTNLSLHSNAVTSSCTTPPRNVKCYQNCIYHVKNAVITLTILKHLIHSISIKNCRENYFSDVIDFT